MDFIPTGGGGKARARRKISSVVLRRGRKGKPIRRDWQEEGACTRKPKGERGGRRKGPGCRERESKKENWKLGRGGGKGGVPWRNLNMKLGKGGSGRVLGLHSKELKEAGGAGDPKEWKRGFSKHPGLSVRRLARFISKM